MLFFLSNSLVFQNTLTTGEKLNTFFTPPKEKAGKGVQIQLHSKVISFIYSLHVTKLLDMLTTREVKVPLKNKDLLVHSVVQLVH